MTTSVLYITKWIQFNKRLTEISYNIVFTIDSNMEEREKEIFFASFKKFPFDLTYQELERNKNRVKEIFSEKIDPFNKKLAKNAYACPLKLIFNEKTESEARICFGGVGEDKKFFEKVDSVRMKAGISFEERFFFTTMLLETRSKTV